MIMKPLFQLGSQSKKSKERIGAYQFDSDDPHQIRQTIQENFDHDSELLDIFTRNKGATVHKWHHYIPLYDRYFSSFRGKKIKFLEIGVSNGGSLQMWREYFGEDAIIYGIDIDPNCERLNGIAGQVRIGSQTDGDFLEEVLQEMGGIDIVLDDGSHHMKHVPKSLELLFPNLNLGGIYMIEDLHTAYWKRFGGGYNAKANFFRAVFDIVNDIHHWYHDGRQRNQYVSDSCTGVHIHDSIVVFEKNNVVRPAHSRIGSE
tara:strand:+ start:1790 stop:2566 length:777 start_codon:yes stop_codon:yes gene_type:complete